MRLLSNCINNRSFRLAALLCVWLLPSFVLRAQSHYASGTYFDKIKQVSESGATPVKAEFNASLESPVNALTGAACFDIPIYTIETGDYKLPVTLHYETSGFKLVDIASNVGMGWNISAGGCITRTVKGLPDERESTGYCSQNHDADSIHDLLLALKDREDLDSLPEMPSPEENSLFAALLDVTDNLIDAEPDVYSFSFASYSGSFVYDMEGDIHLIPKQNFIIQKNTSGFVITVDNGDKYYFGGDNAVESVDTIINTPLFEYINRFETNNASIYYPNRYHLDNSFEVANNSVAWYLTRIVLADSGEQIVFDYDLDQIRTYIGTDETYMMGQRFIDLTYYELQSGNDWTIHRINRYKFSHVPRLRRISWDNGVVDFIPSSDYREDLDCKDYHLNNVGGRSIDSIVISSMCDQLNTHEHLSVGLSHGYFKDHNTEMQPPIGIPMEYRSYYRRLKLDDVTFYDSDDNLAYSYSFLYNSLNPNKCPSRNSCELDCWGYYKPRNESNVERLAIKPQLYYYEGGKENPLYNSVYSVWPRSGEAATCTLTGYNDMVPETAGSQEFTLQSVVLPTKARVVFNYERNDFWFDNQEIKGPGVRVGSVDYYYGDGNNFTKTYTYRDGSVSSGRVSSIPDIGQYQVLPSILFVAPTGLTCERIDFNTARRFSTVTDMKGVSESLVQYSKVTETVNNGNVNMGKTVYYHQLSFTAADSTLTLNDDVFVRKTKCRKSHAHLFPPNSGFGNSAYTAQHLDASPNFTYPIVSWYSGFLSRKEYYDKNNQLVESTDYCYTLKPDNDSVFFIQSRFLERFTAAWTFFDPEGNAMPDVPIYQYDVVWGVNYYKTGVRQLDTIIHRRYDQDNGSLVNMSVEVFGYNDLNYVSCEQTINSDGDTIRRYYNYPNDYVSSHPGSLYQSMLNKNMLNSIVEQYTSVNGRVTSGTYCQFMEFGNNNCFIKPQNIFMLRTESPLLSFHPSSTQLGYDSHYGLKNVLEYDPSSGNVIEVWDETAGTTTYVWGYNDSRIIAEIRNATASQVQNALTYTLDALNGKTDSEELIDIFSDLRTDLPQAMVTSYTYDLFLKLLSVTDPSGRTRRYEYDASQRLRLTRDTDNSILQRFEYHYKQ